MEYRVEDFLSYKLHMIKTNKFKTINVKIVFSKPAKKEEITIQNFLSDMLTYSCSKYKTQKEFSIAMQELYAMSVFSSSYRLGKLYNTDINATFLNEKYTEKGMFEKSLELLREVVFFPNIESNSFEETSFAVIKKASLNQIKSVKESLRKYSLIKMLEVMGKDEEFSYHGYGYIEDLEKITKESLYEYYLDFIKKSKVDIYILGDIEFEKTKKIINKLFKFSTLKMPKTDLSITHSKFRKIPKEATEELNISQSKLSIGCKIEQMTDYEKNYCLPIYSMILGGGSSSKLFTNVREKNSLCYYISASANKLDGILFITSGVAAKSYNKCVKLVKEELKNMEKGKFTEEEIEKAKIQYITLLDELYEDPYQIISFYYSMEVLNRDDYKKRKESINSVNFEDIIQISKKIHLDTIFLLKGND